MDLIINLKRGKVESKGDLELSSGETIETRDFGKGYKYLGILEADDVLQETMKEVHQKGVLQTHQTTNIWCWYY